MYKLLEVKIVIKSWVNQEEWLWSSKCKFTVKFSWWKMLVSNTSLMYRYLHCKITSFWAASPYFYANHTGVGGYFTYAAPVSNSAPIISIHRSKAIKSELTGWVIWLDLVLKEFKSSTLSSFFENQSNYWPSFWYLAQTMAV